MYSSSSFLRNGVVQNGTKNGERKIVLGRNIHTTCLEVTEPDIDDEVTGEREAYMAGIFSIFPSTTWGIPSLKAIMVSTLGSLRMYRMECVKINTLWSGEIDCDGFEAKLLCHKDKPAIVNVNIGTTVKGAMDDLDLVIKKLEEAGFSRDRIMRYIRSEESSTGDVVEHIILD
ncbi:serine decarboxylase [Glycine max]|uniref:serine decarboxylase n=1 Tax=Glycine max TaxID=3847 RepID=UPI001B354730|nr:serine decarboxylase-like [Glycine max]